jgi:signal transduction histidine kinase
MNHLQKFRRRLSQLVFGILLVENALLIGAWWLSSQHSKPPLLVMISACIGALVVSLLTALLVGKLAAEPLKAIWQAILHISPSEHGFPAPRIDKLHVGRELITSLLGQIYQLGEITNKAAVVDQEERKNLSHNFIAQSLPLPLFILDAAETIKFANQAAADYIGITADNLINKNIYMVLDMSFPSSNTFDSWLKSAKAAKATTSNTWERVRLNVRDQHPELLFDLAAYYNRGNPDQIETMLILFDHTKMYSQDDQAISFVALSVHELRTPLTLLRGYIEVFEEELSDKVDPELKGFMDKMSAQAEQLMAYVNNILNVARIDNDQLELRLQEASWSTVLKSAVEALSLQAKVRGKTLHCRIDAHLPPVGIDRLSISEVINNLVDNAIKYSGDSTVIDIEAHLTQDGLVETTVKDFGLGIPISILPNLFTKFYRDHRNRAQIGGNGLGLYLSKAIVTAHGGNLWVRSKEGAGSTFGFTLVPYDQLTQQAKQDGRQELVRGAHGWIKNHSLYRR